MMGARRTIKPEAGCHGESSSKVWGSTKPRNLVLSPLSKRWCSCKKPRTKLGEFLCMTDGEILWYFFPLQGWHCKKGLRQKLSRIVIKGSFFHTISAGVSTLDRFVCLWEIYRPTVYSTCTTVYAHCFHCVSQMNVLLLSSFNYFFDGGMGINLEMWTKYQVNQRKLARFGLFSSYCWKQFLK